MNFVTYEKMVWREITKEKPPTEENVIFGLRDDSGDTSWFYTDSGYRIKDDIYFIDGEIVPEYKIIFWTKLPEYPALKEEENDCITEDLTKEIKIHKIYKVCNCGGKFIYKTVSIDSRGNIIYIHTCSKCGNTRCFDEEYPKTVYKEVE